MILLPIISLGILILCLVGALISFQYFTHYQGLMMLERNHIADQRQRAQVALGYLVVFSFASVIALGGILYPAMTGFKPQPIQPETTETRAPDLSETLPSVGAPTQANPPTATSEPEPEATVTRVLPAATIGNTGGAGANIRSDPGLGGAVIEVLPDGTRVFMLDETREIDGFDWQLIEMPDTRDGWVVTQYLIADN